MMAPVDDMARPAVFNPRRRGEDSTARPGELAGLCRTLRRHPLRIIGRLVWLITELVYAALDYAVRVLLRRSDPPHADRPQWLQRSCRRISRVFNVDLHTTGDIPTRGLLVSNHLGYLDILVLGALTPAIFVAKREVGHWPVLGWFARLAGTLFVHREKRCDVARARSQIERALDDGALVVVFPEGTSSDGDTVLPFKSALLASAADQRHPLAAGYIHYPIADGRVADEVCYWRDMTLVPHLLNLLGKRRISAHVSFTEIKDRSIDRKELARRLHAEVVRLGKQLQ